MTHPRTAKIANAMLEGSFTALLWLAAFALITNDPDYRNLAFLAIGAVSLAIAAILAIPGRWLRAPSQEEQCSADQHSCGIESSVIPKQLTQARGTPRGASLIAPTKPTPQQEHPR